MREIVLYGASLAGEKFYYKYKNKLKIKYVIDKNCGRYFHGILVYNFESKKKSLKGEFVVVAVETDYVYNEISEILKGIGLIEFRDYRMARCLEKKLALIYGNCHIWTLKNYLICNPEFDRQYELRTYYIVDHKNGCPNDNELKECALFLSQDILPNNNFHMPGTRELVKKLNKYCIRIIFPNLYGCNLFFPQAEELDENVVKNHLNINAIKDEQARSTVLWIVGWRDKNIEQMYNKGGV